MERERCTKRCHYQEPLNGRNIGTINPHGTLHLIARRRWEMGNWFLHLPFLTPFALLGGGMESHSTFYETRKISISGAKFSFNVKHENLWQLLWHYSRHFYMIRDGNKTKFLLPKRLRLLLLLFEAKDASWIFQACVNVNVKVVVGVERTWHETQPDARLAFNPSAIFFAASQTSVCLSPRLIKIFTLRFAFGGDFPSFYLR